MSLALLRLVLWSQLAAAAAAQSVAVSNERGVAVSAAEGDLFDWLRDALVVASSLCAAGGPANPACDAAVIGSGALVVLEGVVWIAMSQPEDTLHYLQADYNEMVRVFNEMMSNVNNWKNVSANTSLSEFQTLSVSSGLVVKLAEDFLHITDRAITETLGRLDSTGGNLVAWSPALIAGPLKWRSDALRASTPVLLPMALLITAMSAQGCGSDGHENDQTAHDFLVQISSNMATAIDQVQSLNACVVNPYHLSCTTGQVNVMITASKEDFKRVQSGMTALGSLVNKAESNAPASVSIASPWKKSALAATVPVLRESSSIDSLRALLLRETQREQEIQMELERHTIHIMPAAMVVALAAFVWFLGKSCVSLKERVERRCGDLSTSGDGPGDGSFLRQTLLTTPVLLTALSGLVFLSLLALSAYNQMKYASAHAQATLDNLYNLDSYMKSTLALAQAWAECVSFPCSPDYVSDTMDALMNLTVQLLTDVATPA